MNASLLEYDTSEIKRYCGPWMRKVSIPVHNNRTANCNLPKLSIGSSYIVFQPMAADSRENLN